MAFTYFYICPNCQCTVPHSNSHTIPLPCPRFASPLHSTSIWPCSCSANSAIRLKSLILFLGWYLHLPPNPRTWFGFTFCSSSYQRPASGNFCSCLWSWSRFRTWICWGNWCCRRFGWILGLTVGPGNLRELALFVLNLFQPVSHYHSWFGFGWNWNSKPHPWNQKPSTFLYRCRNHWNCLTQAGNSSHLAFVPSKTNWNLLRQQEHFQVQSSVQMAKCTTNCRARR